MCLRQVVHEYGTDVLQTPASAVEHERLHHGARTHDAPCSCCLPVSRSLRHFRPPHSPAFLVLSNDVTSSVSKVPMGVRSLDEAY